RRTLYRVFNNGAFDHGGRFYGGWWQQVPSRYRKLITINGFPTAELDYSNMQIAMLYAREGLPLAADAYTLDGFPAEKRKLVKQATFKLINATGRIEAPRKEELPDGWDWKRLLAAIEDKHKPISEWFRSGIGLELQR